ncbi:Uncharacterised protein [Legionella donaldsonii]|uniref:Uncharacterized protein n=1 Tax=Legionella donaldsonii TaxID=45060 RepID=A0A378J2M5_9GAMM|nr:hypothetical protein [Legionella donaldsonii]STX41992.1 Uncharacterised protein [Legionella donaldsonii]
MAREKIPGFFHPGSKQPTLILFNYIHYDGIGDFSHLLDIMEALMPLAATLGIKIVPLVICLTERKQTVIDKIAERCPGLTPFIFTADTRNPRELPALFEEFVGNTMKLQNRLRRALSIFQIATATTKEQKDLLLQFCRPGIPVVNISEQCGLRTAAQFSPISSIDERDRAIPNLKNINDRWMGLEKRTYCYGVKIKAPHSMSQADAIQTLENTDFMRALLGHTDSQEVPSEETITEFLRNNQLIPAYLQSKISIIKFIFFCLEQPTLARQGDITFYINNYDNLFTPTCNEWQPAEKVDASGVRLPLIKIKQEDAKLPPFESFLIAAPDYPKLKNLCFPNLKNLGFTSIEINLNGNRRTIVLNSDEQTPKRTIRILTDFKLNDHDYDYLFHIANSVVGVSGDNTLEKALSHEKLPVLQSENKYPFEVSMRVLGQLAHDYLPDVSAAVQEDLERFFGRKNMRLDQPSHWSELLAVDIPTLLTHWQRATPELRVKNNLYTHLDHIFYEALLHMSAATGDITLLHEIYEQFPDIDFTIPNKHGKTVEIIATENGHEGYLQELVHLAGVQSGKLMEMSKRQ